MFRVGMLRGTHGSGLMAISKDEKVSFIKSAGEPIRLMQKEGWKAFADKAWDDSKIVVGHHRFATKGSHTDDNAHPFQHEHITLVHNGTLTSGVSMQEDEVDSSALTRLVAEKGAVEAFKTITGPYACVWWDDKQKAIFFARNGQRPLSICSFRGNFYWASERKMLEWILSRNGGWNFNEKDIQFWEIKEEVIHYFNGGKLMKGETVEKKQYSSTTYYPPIPQSSSVRNKDMFADFMLFSEEIVTPRHGSQYIQYIGLTENNENIFVKCYEPLVDYADKQWHGALKPGPRYNYNKCIDKSFNENAIFYEVEESTLVELIETHETKEDTKKELITLDDVQLSKNLAKRLMKKRCIYCKDGITLAQIPTTSVMRSRSDEIIGLFCPPCTQASYKRTQTPILLGAQQ